MTFNVHLNRYIVVLLMIDEICGISDTIAKKNLTYLLGLSFNQPKFCSDPIWDINASTFLDTRAMGICSRGIFIDYQDSIYVSFYAEVQIRLWSNNSINPVRNFSASVSEYSTLFVSISGDLYFENYSMAGRIDKWRMNGTNSEFVTTFNGDCYGLFIDVNSALYCSFKLNNQVASTSLNNNTNTFIIVAGDGTRGSTSTQLWQPWGIFVNTNSELYVADAGNNRIQRFQLGQQNGITVAGNGIPNNLFLNFPTDVILDADDYMFIADNQNHRIIRVGTSNYSCVAGCSGSDGSAPNQLYKAYSVRFDSRGNMYVADEYNYRIQKFKLTTDSCGIHTTDLPTTTNLQTSTLSITEQQSISIKTNIATTSPNYFNPLLCTNQTLFGTHCNISNDPCSMVQPCQNQGTCYDTDNQLYEYICICVPGFNGTRCQFDHRLCKPHTCWHNGTCQIKSNSNFHCLCENEREGLQCERKTNYCRSGICLNDGVCRPILRDYQCECLLNSFYGRHCEFSTRRLQNLRAATRSVSYVVILVLISVCLFVVLMDILKYYFGIDIARKDLRQTKRRKRQPPVIIRFKYVNRPKVVPSDGKTSVSTVQETNT